MPDVKPIPDNYPRVIPYLTVNGASEAMDFYAKVLGAEERVRMAGPDGKIGHAEMAIGGGVIMLADPFAEMGNKDPKDLGGSPVTVMVYVPDVDAAYERALAAGATGDRPVENQFYGDRAGGFTDPFGHKWHIATHVEDVPDDEMRRRATEAMAPPTGP